MRDFRFTLRTLFGVMTALALALGAICHPTLFSTSAVFSATLVVLGVAATAAGVTRGPRKAFWAGFAVLGWMHLVLALALIPGLAKRSPSLLLSRYCLDVLAEPLGSAMPPGSSVEQELLDGALADYAPGSPPERYYKYTVIGQCVFTLLLAGFGGMLGYYLHRREGLRAPTQPSSANTT